MIKVLKNIWQGWKKVAKVIGRVNSAIILTIFYFLIIGPISLIKSLFDLFKPKKEAKTFWNNYQNPSLDDFKKQF